jgi:tetratricopeptide (TPR) repeat protein
VRKPARALDGDTVLVAVAALALRAAFVVETAHDPLFHAIAIDARFYRDVAIRFAQGDVLLGHAPLWYAPLYPALVGVVFSVAGVRPALIVFAQFLLGILTAVLALRIGRRISPLAGRVAGLVVALSPVPLVYESQLLYTSLALFLTAAFLRVHLGAVRDGKAGVAAGAGGLLGLLSLVSGSALLFAPVGAWHVFRGRGLRAAAAFAGGTALVLAAVLLRNGLVAGAWTPLTVNGGMLFSTGFDPASRGGRALLRTPTDFGPDGAYLREAERAAGKEMSLEEASRWYRARTWDRIRADPRWALGLVVRKAGLLIDAREIDDNLGLSIFAQRSRVLRWLPAPWAWVVLAALAGVVLAGGRRDDVGADTRLLATFVLVFSASLLPFFVTARYRLPLLVPLGALAGAGANGVRGALRRGPSRALLAPAAAVLVAAPLVLRDPGLREEPALAWNAVGAALVTEGRPADALSLLDRAVAQDPTLAGAQQNRALALLALGRSDEALTAAETAVRLDPDLGEAWLTKGALLARAGRVADALPSFRRAVALRPSDPRALEDLARALALTGEPAEAVEVGRRAVSAGARALAPQVAMWEKALSERPGPPPPPSTGPR